MTEAVQPVSSMRGTGQSDDSIHIVTDGYLDGHLGRLMVTLGDKDEREFTPVKALNTVYQAEAGGFCVDTKLFTSATSATVSAERTTPGCESVRAAQVGPELGASLTAMRVRTSSASAVHEDPDRPFFGAHGICGGRDGLSPNNLATRVREPCAELLVLLPT